MKKAMFKNLDGSEICHRIEEDPTEYVNHCVATNHWGKAERWTLKKVSATDLQGNPTFIYHGESYLDVDVLEERIITPVIGESYTEVKLPATYTVEIVDLDQDSNYLLEQCHKNRKAAYPSLGEFADAFVKLQGGDGTQMTAYVAACNAVKIQYPKP